MEKLTETEAFETMVLFLEGFYESTQSDDLGALLSRMIILEDGTTADPTAWDDWMRGARAFSIEFEDLYKHSKYQSQY